MTTPKSTIRTRRFGSALKRERSRAKKTLEEAASALECHPSRVSRVESGTLPLKRREVADLLSLYGTGGEDHSRILALSWAKSKPNWWEAFGLDPAYSDLVSVESDAAYIRTFQTTLIPGLLQTDEYTRAVVHANPALVSEADVERMLTVRNERKEILRRESPAPVRFWAIIAEAALRVKAGGSEVMKGQLKHLLMLTERQNVTLQVVPFDLGAHAGMSGPFVIYDFTLPEDPGVVLLENLTSSLWLETPEEARHYTLVFDDLRSNALHPARSFEFISAIESNL